MDNERHEVQLDMEPQGCLVAEVQPTPDPEKMLLLPHSPIPSFLEGENLFSVWLFQKGKIRFRSGSSRRGKHILDPALLETEDMC